VAALRANNRYGRVGIDELRDAATRLGHPFMAELNYQVGDPDFAPQLDRLRALEPEAIVTWGDARESALILKQMRAMGMEQLFVGSDRIVSGSFLELAGDAAHGVVAGSPWDPGREDGRLRRFNAEFTDRFGEPPETYAAHAYDGVVMLVEAIDRAGLNRARIRDELAAATIFCGVSGTKTFDAVYSNRGPVYLAIPEDGEFVFYDRADAVGE
jgi:ABC-type branched-subunit amino acid transport system substrate-binding protein